MKTIVYNGKDLENNTLMDWEPVKLMEEWCDAINYIKFSHNELQPQTNLHAPKQIRPKTTTEIS